MAYHFSFLPNHVFRFLISLANGFSKSSAFLKSQIRNAFVSLCFPFSNSLISGAFAISFTVLFLWVAVVVVCFHLFLASGNKCLAHLLLYVVIMITGSILLVRDVCLYSPQTQEWLRKVIFNFPSGSVILLIIYHTNFNS